MPEAALEAMAAGEAATDVEVEVAATPETATAAGTDAERVVRRTGEAVASW